jgi:HK97 family phage major capsid protein
MENRTELYGFLSENTIARSRATIIRMARRQVQIPVLDQTGTTAGVPHWFGGMSFYWGEEAKEKTATDASFRQVTLTANKLYGLTRASDELVDDSAISLGDFLSGPMGFSGGIAWMEDYAFIQGTGVGQPLGILKAGATLTVPRVQDSPAFSFDDAANMRAAFLPTGRGVWIINQSLMDEVITMNGPSANPSYVWQPNARDGIPGMLLGFPVIWTEKTPVAGQVGDVMLVDWTYYLIGDRQATTIESTKFDKWAYDLTSWRAVHRVDGQPWLSTPLTLQDGSTQISPFVILGQKSS